MYDYDFLHSIFRDKRVDVGLKHPQYAGILLPALLEQKTGNPLFGIRMLEHMVECVGAVHPVTLTQSELCVELTNGEIVVGEDNIDRPAYDRRHTICRAWLQPMSRIHEAAQRAIETADVIVFGPGSLYTSIIATLAVKGMADALRVSKARFIHVVARGYHINGETGPTTLSGVIDALQVFLPRPADHVVYNNSTLTPAQLHEYARRQWSPLLLDVEHIDPTNAIGRDFEDEVAGISVEKLSVVFQEIV